ncbi:TatD family hydrolase [Clostridium luticellarii]|jgi:TatD DNase family protein|uniref:Putative deoxyribonuclease YcfH n=1 Tax=Clostridium luticellarii TaxID=1691940 RepID=A0A2T0BE70_9CLOT|nr:TatD family hydrolase [Clostridium luticellarii]MCI1944912.1 TatD family hydrolase [Clostridium luticellarii]MCI1968412.1 TatD family hydrolase [Clostridium luticellarii]MCI1995410.1 TatD family hydrolase [Clostridium luticellarii]MCI2039473.1 TatD family hydrolase [Clostridium luticellarii]PRR82127.1 putative deoxyribonuclease YcfH [Clostridium luticellarii]
MAIDIFDAHAHYDDEQFDKDREKIIEELKNNNIVGVLNCGSSMEGSRVSVKLAEKHRIFYAAVGIHPEYADKCDCNTLKELKELTKSKKVRAIGEIGLDYHYEENPSKNVQKSVFIKQMELAQELNLPVIIHDREAHEDTLNIIKQFKDVIGEIHCFSGSVEFARECLKLGYYIGFTGVVTFKNAKKVINVAKEVPLDRILVETDCPYMTPVPFRGKRNRSEYIQSIIGKIAEIKGLSIDNISKATISNIKCLLDLE